MLKNKSVKRKDSLVFLSKTCALILCTFLANVPLFTFGQIDPLEYPPGHPNNITVTYTQQLQAFPVPRFKPGHTLLPNYNVIDPTYSAGYKQPGVSDGTAWHNSVINQTELAKNFNYMINVTWNTGAYNDSCIALANQYPQYKVALMTLRAQTQGSKMWYQGFANDHYLQNSGGQFLDWNGNVTTGSKVWRPTAPASDYSADGTLVRGWLNSSLSNLTRPVDLVNEDGEVYPILETQALMNDPVVSSAKAASGLDWQPYLANRIANNDNLYSAQFMTHPRLTNAKYSEYRLDGHPTNQIAWSEARHIDSQINGQYYSTTDLYVRWPYNWQNWVSAWHGLKWITQSRYFELSVGDKLFSPFVAAGWDANPENDVRPAQWLGLMKIMGMYGSEFYYAGYFNEAANYNPPNPPPNNPAGYAWQSVVPSYAQAITSRYEDLLRNGSLMAGDMIDYSNPILPSPFYQFSTGASNKVVIIRKSNTANKYAITGAIENTSNTIGSTPLVDDAQITLNSQTLKFKVRRQGSTYIYDNTVPSAPVFYQLDAWHESSHPWYWSKDFNLEAELYDNTNATYNLVTTVPNGTAAGDFRSYTTYITFPDAQTSFTPIEYVFTPRVSATTYYLWVKMRSRVTGVTTGCTVSVDNANTKTISCASDNNWQWYKVDVTSQQAISFTNLSVGNHTLRITPANSKLEIDQVVLSINPNLGLTPAGPVCSTGCTSSISANGPLTFNQGGSVTLTANTGSSYLWSPGNQTSQSIVVTAAGVYSVRVTNSGGCSAISSPVTVTVNGGQQGVAFITPNGPTTFCQGSSVHLNANAGLSYIWSNGKTTQGITVTTAGSYVVTVTFTSNISTSTPVNVVVNTCNCPIPGNLSESSVSASAATLNWGAVTGVDSLKIRLRDVAANTYYYSNSFSGTSTQATLSVSPSTKYAWRIQSKCGSIWTSYSVREVFITPAFRLSNPAVSDESITPMYAGEDDRLDSDAGLQMESGMDIYPNPASVSATVSYNAGHTGSINIQFMDFTGKMMKSESHDLAEGMNHYELDLRNLAKGVYVLILNDNGIINTKKIVVN